jgi:hypothetical protein
MSPGFAREPTSLDTHMRNSSFSSGVGALPDFSVTKAAIAAN